MATIGGLDDDEIPFESRWWRGSSEDDVPVEVELDVDVEEVALAVWLVDALPGMVAAAMTLKTPSPTTEPAAIQVVRSLSSPIATSRARIRASLEFIAVHHHLTAASEHAERRLRTGADEYGRASQSYLS